MEYLITEIKIFSQLDIIFNIEKFVIKVQFLFYYANNCSVIELNSKSNIKEAILIFILKEDAIDVNVGAAIPLYCFLEKK